MQGKSCVGLTNPLCQTCRDLLKCFFGCKWFREGNLSLQGKHQRSHGKVSIGRRIGSFARDDRVNQWLEIVCRFNVEQAGHKRFRCRCGHACRNIGNCRCRRHELQDNVDGEQTEFFFVVKSFPAELFYKSFEAIISEKNERGDANTAKRQCVQAQ